MMRSLADDEKSRWPKYAQKLAHAYNCTRNDATGFSPFKLLFGRNPRLPIDLLFEQLNQPEKKNYTKFVSDWKDSMQEVYQRAGGNAEARMAASRAFANRKVHATILEPGD